MLKPDAVRKTLVAAMPDYGRDPDRLAIFAEKGRIATRFHRENGVSNLNFEWRYTLVVLLLDYIGHPDVPMLTMLRWLQTGQPELLQNHGTANEAISFTAEILAGGTIDLELKVELTEAVKLVPRDDGGFDLPHLEEPAFDPIAEGFPENAPPLTEIWLGDRRLLPPITLEI